MNLEVRIASRPDEWKQILAMRVAVFVDEQGGPADDEPDHYDPISRHIVAREVGETVGCARLIDFGQGRGKIGRVAVRRDRRGAGIGDALMRFALARLSAEGFESVELDAQLPVIPFYERFGFVAGGPQFLDGGILHRKMVMELVAGLSRNAGGALSTYRSLFPHARTGIHLNHAGLAPIALPVSQAAAAAVDALLCDNTLQAYVDHAERERRLRQLVARMVNAPASTIGFVRNTSHGLSIAASNLPRKPDGNTVCIANDYPSQVYPWMARGPVKLVAPRPDGWVHEQDLEAACDRGTDVMAVSWVHWTSGQELDLQRLGSFCRKRGITFVVDVVQGLGALRLDLGSLPVDIAAAGCHKWMMAPAGIGVLYVHPETMKQLGECNIGWNSVENPMDWDRLHFEDLRPTPRRYEEGSPSLASTAALLASLEIMESAGFDDVDKRVRELAQQARLLLQSRGIIVSSASTTSGIVPFRHPGLSSSSVAETLDGVRVRCAVRGGWVRFSPHFYMNEAEIESAVANVPSP